MNDLSTESIVGIQKALSLLIHNVFNFLCIFGLEAELRFGEILKMI